MSKVTFQTLYAHGKVEPFKCIKPSLTQQCFEAQSNINTMVKCNIPLQAAHDVREAIYNTTVTGDEFINALNTSNEVKNYFEQLPVKAKSFFDYKPQKMLDFVKNPDNFEKAYSLGLIDKKTYYAKKAASKASKIENSSNSSNASSEVISAPEINPNLEG